MSAFEDFVAIELPLRPFAATDGNQESIAIRRGVGPRQMQFLDLVDGQVLARVGGVLQGVTLAGMSGNGQMGGVRHTVVDVALGNEQSNWNIVHNFNSYNCVANVFQQNPDGSFLQVIPDVMKLVNANTVSLAFSTPIAGKVVLSFVD